jgi:hypothetical protein
MATGFIVLEHDLKFLPTQAAQHDSYGWREDPFEVSDELMRIQAIHWRQAE